MISLQVAGSFSCFTGIAGVHAPETTETKFDRRQRYPETSGPYKNGIHLKP
jgi:hypothetical protein